VDLLEATRLALALLMMAGGALLDLKSRRVPNAYWLPFAMAAAALLAIDAGLHGLDALTWPMAVALLVAAFAYVAWRFRLYGGADAKALMVLAFLVPGLPADRFTTVFAVDTVMDGTLLAVAYPFALLAWNALRGHLRLPAALLGTPMDLEAARKAHVWPMQDITDSKVRWHYWTRVGTDAQAAFDRLAAAGIQRPWVTAKIPLLALLALGAAAAAVWGNLPLRALTALAP
jgi:Flp pilus assembly protein protease CpaA